MINIYTNFGRKPSIGIRETDVFRSLMEKPASKTDFLAELGKLPYWKIFWILSLQDAKKRFLLAAVVL